MPTTRVKPPINVQVCMLYKLCTKNGKDTQIFGKVHPEDSVKKSSD